MNLTISLDEPLAGQLREEASAQSLPPEQALRTVLQAGFEVIAELRWREANERRIELIYKERDGVLTTAEGEELERLQDAAAARVAPMDRLLVAGVERALRQAKERRDAAQP